MICNVDGRGLFLPYVMKLNNLTFDVNLVKRIFFSINEDDSLIGLELDFINTDAFKRLEYNLRMKGIQIIDNTSDTIVLVLDRDDELDSAISSYLSGNFSLIRNNKKLLKAYIEGKEIGDLKNDTSILVIRQDVKLRKLVEDKIGCSLNSDAELGIMPNRELYNLTIQ